MKNKKTKILLVVLFLTLASAVAVVLLEKDDKINLFGAETTNTTSETEPFIDLTPPTEADKEQVDENKERIVQRDESIDEQPAPSGIQKTIPSISYAGQYNDQIEIGAVVPIFEEGGTCTATLIKDAAKVNKSVTAVQNVRSVDCPVMRIPRSEMPSAGTWTVVVSYSSANYSGESSPRELEVK